MEKSADDIIAKALKTQDSAELYKLIEKAVDMIKFTQSQLALSKGREQKLNDQVTRHTAMIANLEKSLWSVKKITRKVG